MNEDKIKRMLDACYLAKRIRELLPELPEGVTPAYIQYMDVIHKLKKKSENVKVSDISDYLKLPRPGVTRTVKEMEKKGYLSKYASNEDGRITYIAITEKGGELSERYDKNYYSRLLKYMDDISDDEADCMISTIEKFYKVMSERRVEIE
jgi:DNA-binding MarR family transcriptional regulator